MTEHGVYVAVPYAEADPDRLARQQHERGCCNRCQVEVVIDPVSRGMAPADVEVLCVPCASKQMEEDGNWRIDSATYLRARRMSEAERDRN